MCGVHSLVCVVTQTSVCGVHPPVCVVLPLSVSTHQCVWRLPVTGWLHLRPGYDLDPVTLTSLPGYTYGTAKFLEVALDPALDNLAPLRPMRSNMARPDTLWYGLTPQCRAVVLSTTMAWHWW